MEKAVKITSKGDQDGVRVRRMTTVNRFAKYRGIGNEGIGSGKKAIRGWIREMRGR
jgi:hypothetical protein